MRYIKELTDSIVNAVNSKNNQKLVGLSLSLRWNDNVSNSHSAPRGKHTNFYAHAGLPTSYPGWSGRAWARFANGKLEGFSSCQFNNTGLHPGSGGYGGYDGPWQKISSRHYAHNYFVFKELQIYSWDCKIFAEDFPDIVDLYKTEMAFKILSGDDGDSKCMYLWEDPEQRAEDAELIKRWQDSQINKNTPNEKAKELYEAQ
jgi:hypothetical protein